jgi:D-alanine-D-alanine ligase
VAPAVRKKLRVIVLMHEDLVPPDDLTGLDEKEILRFKTERDVVEGLARLGHEVHKLGVWDELAPLRTALWEWKPDIVFNLLEEFRGQAVYDQNVVSYLELMRAAYTGCNPRGLVLARDKALSKKILHYHRIRVPRFAVAPLGRRFKRPKRLEFPLIVKSLVEEASTGISKASVVTAEDKLADRVRFVHEHVQTDAIVEEYIEGREIYVGVLGNDRLTVLPAWELFLDGLPADSPRIATRRMKIDPDFQERHEVMIGEAEQLSADLLRFFARTCKRIYRTLGLSGYARLDFRLGPDGKVYFLEANPNPEIAASEEFAAASEAAGMSYDQMLERILRLGLRRAARA